MIQDPDCGDCLCDLEGYELAAIMKYEKLTDALIDIAVSNGPRAYFGSYGPGQDETNAYDPVADWRSPRPENFRRAMSYVNAARALGIL